jgi:large subunit ribosomal protein L37Ae
MVKKVTFGSIKRFGTRYGASKKLKFAQVEIQHRGKHKCPYCRYEKARRIAAGIWTCEKCKNKFTARAFSLTSTVPSVKEETHVKETKMSKREQAREDNNNEAEETA